MNDTTAPVLKDLVLIGGGHAHVIVLKRLGMDPMPGLRVTVISRDVQAPYSGMLPGLIAGHYQFDEVHIDLTPLCGFAGARLYRDEAVGLDLATRRVHCRHRPPVSYDLLSIDIGVTPVLTATGAVEHAVPVKPITTLVARWERLKERVRQTSRAMRIGIVGAGAAGVELTLAIQHAVRRLLADDGRPDDEPEFHLFSATAQILPTPQPSRSWQIRARAPCARRQGPQCGQGHEGQSWQRRGPGRLPIRVRRDRVGNRSRSPAVAGEGRSRRRRRWLHPR